MTEELSLPCPYKVHLDHNRNSYQFTTNTGALYEMLFTADVNILVSTALEGAEIYHAVIEKRKAGTGVKDKNIELTINSIIEHFYESRDRFMTYVCDPTDERDLIRERLFNSWYSNSSLRKQLVKLDGEIGNEEGSYITSLVYHKENSFGEESIKHTFDRVIELLNSVK